MRDYILSPEAKQDLRDIRKHYLKEADARVAKRVLEAIERATERVAGLPGAGHSRPDLTGDPVKFWQVFSYLVIYDPAPRPIEIVRVLHSSRDIAAVLSS